MENNLQELIKISKEFSMDYSLVVGTGGNTSVKTDDNKHMYIKASGTALKNVSETHGWRRLNNDSVLAIFNDKKLAALGATERELEIVKLLQSACDDDQSDARPSVESTLHVILDKCVIHLHALTVLSYACAKNGKTELLKLFKDEQYPPLWVPYADPGFGLSWEVFRKVNGYVKEHGKKPAMMVLEKHGLLVADETSDGVIALVKKMTRRCREGLKTQENTGTQKIKQEEICIAKQAIQEALADVAGQETKISHFYDQTIAAFLAREDAQQLLKNPALTPDEMGFVSSPIVWLDSCDHKSIADKISAELKKSQKTPVAFLINGIGLLVLGDSKLASITSEIIIGSLFVRSNAQDIGRINPLTIREQEFIQNWEGEKFRVNLAKSS